MAEQQLSGGGFR